MSVAMTSAMPSTVEKPPISVLICTRNRAEDLSGALPTVLANTYPDYEVLVVDQSDGTDTKEVVARLQAEHSRRLRYIPTETRGLSYSRNIAIEAAQHDLLAFTDDDCIVPTDWVAKVATLFTEADAPDLLFGIVMPPGDKPENVIVPSLYFPQRQVLTRGKLLGMGANMAFRRAVIDKMGGYDTALGGGAVLPGGEDFDFSYRAQRAGFRVVADPRLTLVHRTWRQPEEWERIVTRCGIGDAAVFMKHIRCGDQMAMEAFGRYMGISARRTVGEVVRNLRLPKDKRTRSKQLYFRSLLQGIGISRRYPIDKARGLYLTPSPAGN